MPASAAAANGSGTATAVMGPLSEELGDHIGDVDRERQEPDPRDPAAEPPGGAFGLRHRDRRELRVALPKLDVMGPGAAHLLDRPPGGDRCCPDREEPCSEARG